MTIDKLITLLTEAKDKGFKEVYVDVWESLRFEDNLTYIDMQEEKLGKTKELCDGKYSFNVFEQL